MEQLAPGDPRRIGAYRLIARLGAGGMGQVYLARSDRGRTVAVKLVRPELAAQESFRTRFRHEVNAARRVGGEWTAPVLDADTEAAVPWVATGYVAGPALSDVVNRVHGPLPERSVRILGRGLAHALRSVHGAGLVHRDLKPSNILITIDGPRVIDFGIARALEASADAGITRTGAVVGSPGYMAPEQVRGLRLTPAADVFCLGTILMFAATGRLPFGPADSAGHAVMFRIAEEEPDLAGLPGGLLELVRDCLRKDPEGRPAPAEIVARTTAIGADPEPWLPGALVAELGRHAVRLLEFEHNTGAHRRADLPVTPPLPGGTPDEPSYGYDYGYAYGGGPETAAPGGTGGLSGPQPIGHGPGAVPGPLPQVGPGAGVSGTAGTVAETPGPPPSSHSGAMNPPGRVLRAGDRRRRRARLVLAAALGIGALVVVGVVYAVKSTGDGADSARKPAGKTTEKPDPGNSGTSDTVPDSGGDIPGAYLGTWRATFASSQGENIRTMTIGNGTTGEKVMKLTGTGPGYSCTWSATLKSAGTPLELGPTEVETGDRASCSPGQWSTLTMPDGSTIVRELVGSGGEPLRYIKQ
ncbi:serine/threonine-protein kinase [Streptomyces sp. NPDC006798]|uniref:serine/threonine-protein kinase n=1 Tax=Streptomyces sp. NPDC006798 TaxID=3155462 RepID=UPI0033FA4F13